MDTHRSARRDFHGLEQRRFAAARLFAAGTETDGAIARRLGVSRQSVMRWHRAWSAGGRQGLRAAGRAGRKPKLARAEWAAVDARLRQGPQASGFPTAVWTLPRVAAVIEQVSGVRYHPGHVWRLLRAGGWTPQRPATRARERDEAAIQQWRTERWPAVKKTPGAAARGSSSTTRAGSPSARPSAAPGRRGGRPRS